MDWYTHDESGKEWALGNRGTWWLDDDTAELELMGVITLTWTITPSENIKKIIELYDGSLAI